MKNYSPVRDKKGRISHVGEREVNYVDFTVHEDNVVDVYRAWEHNVEDITVLALKIEQKGSPNINSVYTIIDGNVEEQTYGYNRLSEHFSNKKTKEDIIEEAKNWMENNPWRSKKHR